jgi:uncharacterized Zn finger protein
VFRRYIRKGNVSALYVSVIKTAEPVNKGTKQKPYKFNLDYIPMGKKFIVVPPFQ